MSKLIKCLSYNIHKGFSQTNAHYQLEKIRYAIRQTGVDIVFLQEVIGEHQGHQNTYKNWPEDSQFEFLADQVWPHYAYGKNAIYSHGHHGNAILSMQPFSHSQNYDISRWRFSQRGILHGVIAGKIHLYCVHLGLLAYERRFQFQQLIKIIEASCPANAPLIIAGDFNDWQGRLNKRLQQSLNITDAHQSHTGKLALSFPAFMPMLAMDRIYTRGFKVIHSEIFKGKQWQRLSDHCALYSELELQQ